MFKRFLARFKPKTSLETAMIVVVPKIAHTATQARDNFVEMRHPDGFLGRYRLKITLTHDTNFKFKEDAKPYWDHLKQVSESMLPGMLSRVCISGHLYSIK